MSAIARLRPALFVLVALVLYVAVTGFGLMVEGYNPDDWRLPPDTDEIPYRFR